MMTLNDIYEIAKARLDGEIPGSYAIELTDEDGEKFYAFAGVDDNCDFAAILGTATLVDGEYSGCFDTHAVSFSDADELQAWAKRRGYGSIEIVEP